MISAVMLQKKVSLSLAKGVEAEVAVHGGGAGILPDGSRASLPRVLTVRAVGGTGSRMLPEPSGWKPDPRRLTATAERTHREGCA